MLLIYVKKESPRVSYIFRHICQRILGVQLSFSTSLEDFLAYEGPKISYGKKPLGNELFFQSSGLLFKQGVESEEINIKTWEETIGFFSVGTHSALPFDIFSASFYMLSRYEEYLPQVKDPIGRFSANESLAYQQGFLNQPVVDLWAYKFKNVLERTFPSLSFVERKLNICPLIEASQAFAYSNRGFFRNAKGYLEDLLRGNFRKIHTRTKVLLGFQKDPYNTFKWIVNTAQHSQFKIFFFFLLGDSFRFEDGLNYKKEKFKLLIKYVADYEKVGIMFSYAALSNYEALKKEKRNFESIINRSLDHSINAEMLVNLPEVYRHLIELEITNDYTMAFSDMPGFRAGTCTPFLFYDLDYEIKTPLLLQPVALTTTMLNPENHEIERIVDRLLEEVRKVNGSFIMRFSNTDFTEIERNKFWRSLLSEKLGAQK